MKKIMDYRYLKIVALIAMTLDHIGAILMPEAEALRIIGRISFPIFLFMIVNSYLYTSDICAFAKRLYVFTAVSFVPYYLAFGRLFNIGFVYIAALTSLFFFDYMLMEDEETKEKNAGLLLLAVSPVLITIIGQGKLQMEYGWFPIVAVIIIYYRKSLGAYESAILTSIVGIIYALSHPADATGMLISLPVYYWLFANEERLTYTKQTGFRKYFYYIYYLAHLLILVIIKAVIL